MAADGRLMFETGIDNSGFSNGVNNLQAAANVAMGNIAANMVNQMSSAAAQIPQQMINVGSGFEASMSQVAATMGITSAAAEFQTLSAAAKEMGESTKFSASQAGEALNYLALAGYDANKAVAALPTVLNVAAAGGMELAAASDMITDAMSALGLETSQMADFSDKLAVTAQKSNTSVSQLGEAILTVGGTAKMLSGGVTEMNTALGILADNGIKGSEGGTALRNVILSLSAPTDTAAAALESLGVTAFDASGAMRPLQDTFADLNTALSSLSDQERTAVLNEIFNKVDLKSVNALLGTSSERFDELSGYISDCAGAAAQMAETMDDNLKGDLTIMQSALEGLGIAAYEKFQTPMRTAIQSVTSSVGDLSESLTNGELYHSFDKISDGFSSIVDSGAEFLTDEIIPGIIEGAGWIVDNFGVLKTVFITTTTAVIAYQTATKGAAAAQALFTAALNANPLVLAASAIVGVTAAIAAYVIQADAAIHTQDELKKESDEIIAKSQAEASVVEYKAERYKRLYEQYKETGEASNEMKLLAEDLQRLAPDTISLVDEETESYKELDDSINDVIDSMRRKGIEQAKQNTLQGHYDNIAEYAQKQIEAEKKFIDRVEFQIENTWLTAEDIAEIEKGVNGKFAAFYNDTADNSTMIDGHNYYELIGVIGDYEMALSNRNNAVDKWQAKIDEEQAAIEGLDAAYSNLYETQNKSGSPTYSLGGSDYKSSAQMAAEEYAANYKAVMLGTSQKISDAQTETTAALEAAWKQAEHNYATGVIATEAELYRQKAALLDQYGNADLEDHWKYYEDLYAYQKESAENSIKLAEETAREQADIRDREWNNIAHKQSVGLLSAEDAYREQLAFIKKYCPEYSDEWYSYYQTVLEYQRDAQQKQVDSVKDGISELVAEYKSAFKELESERNSYKNRLMSVGSLFSVDTETDENGNTTKIVSVENMRKQMAEMQKYHDYITKLKAQGATDGFIGELASMDFEDGLFTAENLANMSESEFKEINELYRQKEELADKLSNELFEPEMNELKEGLVNGVLEKFGTLPTEIQEIGAESLAAFIAGLTDGDISEQVEEFAEKFAADCAEGIQNSFANTELDYAALMNADTYSIGKSAGDEYVEGFNEALAQIQSAIAAEQSFAAAGTAPKRYSETVPQTTAETSAGGTSAERIVIQNHIEVDMDGEKVAEKVIEKEEIINYRKDV